MAIYKLLLTTKTHIRCKGQSLLHILWIINLSIIGCLLEVLCNMYINIQVCIYWIPAAATDAVAIVGLLYVCVMDIHVASRKKNVHIMHIFKFNPNIVSDVHD